MPLSCFTHLSVIDVLQVHELRCRIAGIIDVFGPRQHILDAIANQQRGDSNRAHTQLPAGQLERRQCNSTGTTPVSSGQQWLRCARQTAVVEDVLHPAVHT